jgi:hypothetical protein
MASMNPSPFARHTAAALLACAMVLPGAHAGKAQVSIGATVIPVLRLTVLDARADATTIEVHSNQARYAMHFEIVDPAVTSVEIDGLQAPVLVGRSGRTVFVSTDIQGRSIKTLNYRVRYANDVEPGTRGVPLRLYLQNI